MEDFDAILEETPDDQLYKSELAQQNKRRSRVDKQTTPLWPAGVPPAVRRSMSDIRCGACVTEDPCCAVHD